MRLVVVVFVALAALPLGALDRELLNDEAARRCFVQLLADSGWGRRSDERAAFLIADGDVLRCEHWPSRRGFQSERYDGPIPAGTIAVVHTHPRALPNPSANDVDVARRLGFPVLVLTPRAVTVARANGEVDRLIAQSGWYER